MNHKHILPSLILVAGLGTASVSTTQAQQDTTHKQTEQQAKDTKNLILQGFDNKSHTEKIEPKEGERSVELMTIEQLFDLNYQADINNIERKALKEFEHALEQRRTNIKEKVTAGMAPQEYQEETDSLSHQLIQATKACIDAGIAESVVHLRSSEYNSIRKPDILNNVAAALLNILIKAPINGVKSVVAPASQVRWLDRNKQKKIDPPQPHIQKQDDIISNLFVYDIHTLLDYLKTIQYIGSPNIKESAKSLIDMLIAHIVDKSSLHLTDKRESPYIGLKTQIGLILNKWNTKERIERHDYSTSIKAILQKYPATIGHKQYGTMYLAGDNQQSKIKLDPKSTEEGAILQITQQMDVSNLKKTAGIVKLFDQLQQHQWSISKSDTSDLYDIGDAIWPTIFSLCEGHIGKKLIKHGDQGNKLQQKLQMFLSEMFRTYDSTTTKQYLSRYNTVLNQIQTRMKNGEFLYKNIQERYYNRKKSFTISTSGPHMVAGLAGILQEMIKQLPVGVINDEDIVKKQAKSIGNYDIQKERGSATDNIIHTLQREGNHPDLPLLGNHTTIPQKPTILTEQQQEELLSQQFLSLISALNSKDSLVILKNKYLSAIHQSKPFRLTSGLKSKDAIHLEYKKGEQGEDLIMIVGEDGKELVSLTQEVSQDPQIEHTQGLGDTSAHIETSPTDIDLGISLLKNGKDIVVQGKADAHTIARDEFIKDQYVTYGSLSAYIQELKQAGCHINICMPSKHDIDIAIKYGNHKIKAIQANQIFATRRAVDLIKKILIQLGYPNQYLDLTKITLASSSHPQQGPEYRGTSVNETEKIINIIPQIHSTLHLQIPYYGNSIVGQDNKDIVAATMVADSIQSMLQKHPNISIKLSLQGGSDAHPKSFATQFLKAMKFYSDQEKGLFSKELKIMFINNLTSEEILDQLFWKQFEAVLDATHQIKIGGTHQEDHEKWYPSYKQDLETKRKSDLKNLLALMDIERSKNSSSQSYYELVSTIITTAQEWIKKNMESYPGYLAQQRNNDFKKEIIKSLNNLNIDTSNVIITINPKTTQEKETKVSISGAK